MQENIVFDAIDFKSKNILEKIKLTKIKGIFYYIQKDINNGSINFRILDIVTEKD